MKLKVLKQGNWKVVTPISCDSNECQLEHDLADLAGDKKLKAYAAGFLILLERSTIQGPGPLGTNLYHCVDSAEGIYEYIKGPFRLLCFEAEGAVVICSHIIRKQRDKISAKDKAPAIRVKNEYLAALAENDIEFIVQDDGDE